MKRLILSAFCILLAVFVLASCRDGGGDPAAGSSADSLAESAESSGAPDGSSGESGGGEDSKAHSAAPYPVTPPESGNDETVEMTEIDNGYVTFLVPSYCTEFEGDGVIVVSCDTAFDIVVSSEPYDERYLTMTVADFVRDEVPALEAEGMQVISPSVYRELSASGQEMTVIKYGAVIANAKITRTTAIVPTGDVCQMITLTENLDCGDFAEYLLQSISVNPPFAEDADANG